MRIISEQNIGRVSFFFIVIVVSVIIFAVGVFFIVRKNESAYNGLETVEQTLIEHEKTRLQANVDSFLLRIQALHDQFITLPETELESETDGSADTPEDSVEPDWERVVEELQNAGDLKTGGYFIYELHNSEGGERFATMRFNPARPDLVGQLLSTDFPDAKGFNFRKVFLKDIRDHGESFVIYHFKQNEEPDQQETSSIGRKLAYFKLYPEYNWIVAKNIELDWIDRLMEARQAGLNKENKNNIVILGIIFLGSMFLALILAFLLSLGIRQLFDHYRTKKQEILARSEALQKMLEKQNRADTLTSAFNRGHFIQELVKEMARSQRYGTPLTMVLFDLDEFKSINDHFGCEAGDTVLVELVELVNDHIRQTDILARWGGEEFVILAPGIDLAHGKMFAEKLRRVIEEFRFSIDHRITCSFGIGFYQSSESQHEFVQRTDEALGRAKNDGKNSCVAV